MKKYHIEELSVVKLEEMNKVYFFICKCNTNKKTYIEIFTHEELKNDCIKEVTPLKEYYSSLEIARLHLNSSLMLNKKDLLLKYTKINKSLVIDSPNEWSDWQEYQKKELDYWQQLSKNNPEMAKQVALESLQRSGILDKNGELAVPYNEGIVEQKELIKKPIN